VEGRSVYADLTCRFTYTLDGRVIAEDEVHAAVVQVSIVPLAGNRGVNGDLVNSNHQAGARKQYHYVTPKSVETDTVSFQAEVLPAAIPFEGNFEWVGGTARPAGNGRQVPRNQQPGVYPLSVRATGQTITLDAMNVWVAWCSIDGSASHLEVEQLHDRSPLYPDVLVRVGTRVRARYECTASVSPMQLISGTDRPDIPGQNPAIPPGTTDPYGHPLSEGVNARWDMSRRIAIRNETTAQGVPADWLVVADFPQDPRVGNDDADVRGEDNNPYHGRIGTLSDVDYPSRRRRTACGVAGDTYTARIWLQEFVRMQIGAQWFVVSAPDPWRVEFRFVKRPVTERLWGGDYNGDGQISGTVSEADIQRDMNDDGDTDDPVAFWDDNGSLTANDNAGYP
jgi:hypothetical protein